MVKKKTLLTMMFALIGLVCMMATVHPQVDANASSHRTYDLSEWQGRLTARKVKQLKKEVPFVILRVQYGTGHKDYTFSHNQALLRKYKLPYGVYSFSLYHNSASAASEARELYRRARHAKFFVNDFEVTSISSGVANRATRKWATTLRKLVGKRKILFYSYQSFMWQYAAKALNKYNGYWVAAYTNQEPSVNHVMWQYTDHFYSRALNKNVDASKLRRSKHWFIGRKHHRKKVKARRRVTVHAKKDAASGATNQRAAKNEPSSPQNKPEQKSDVDGPQKESHPKQTNKQHHQVNHKKHHHKRAHKKHHQVNHKKRHHKRAHKQHHQVNHKKRHHKRAHKKHHKMIHKKHHHKRPHKKHAKKTHNSKHHKKHKRHTKNN